MSGENIGTAAHRQKRVQWIKRCIISTILLLILFPTVLCVDLYMRMRRLDSELKELKDQLEMLAAETAAQQDTIQELIESMRTTGQGSQAENDSSLEYTGYELTTLNKSEESDTVETVSSESEESDTVETNSDESEGAETVETFESTEPVSTAAHKVYLTFDDGPSTNTEKILDILDEYDVKATFFVVGKDSKTAKEALKQIVDRGHTLGMHSYSHKYSDIYSSEENFAADFEKIRNYLEEVTGVTSIVYRFPGGSSNKVSKLDMHVFIDYLDTEGVRFFDWNISSGDASKTQLTVDQIVENATKGIEKKGTSVILMHDAVSKATTLEALPLIIEKILEMDDTAILPITEDTVPIQHLKKRDNNN